VQLDSQQISREILLFLLDGFEVHFSSLQIVFDLLKLFIIFQIFLLKLDLSLALLAGRAGADAAAI
jgi:hypothetical protein